MKSIKHAKRGRTSNATIFHGVQPRANSFESAFVVMVLVIGLVLVVLVVLATGSNGPCESADGKQCSNNSDGEMHF